MNKGHKLLKMSKLTPNENLPPILFRNKKGKNYHENQRTPSSWLLVNITINLKKTTKLLIG